MSSSEDQDFDVCRISQDDTRFSSSLTSPFCPQVGTCGHSFSKKSLQDWFEVRQKQEYHRETTMLPCPYKCSETIRGQGGKMVQQEINSFYPHRLVANHSICQAVEVIRGATQEGKEGTVTAFDKCPKCQLHFATQANMIGGKKQHPQTPMVSLCGHTVCLGCLEGLFVKRKGKAIKSIRCPVCKQGKAFICDKFVENIDFGKALRHWKAIQSAALLEAKELGERKSKTKKSTTKVVNSARKKPKLVCDGQRKRRQTSQADASDNNYIESRPTTRSRKGNKIGC